MTSGRRVFLLGVTAVSMTLWLLMAETTFYRAIFALLLVASLATAIWIVVMDRRGAKAGL